MDMTACRVYKIKGRKNTTIKEEKGALMDLNRLEIELAEHFGPHGWEDVARYVALMVLEARIDELMIHQHGEGYYDTRIAELELEIDILREG